MAKTPKKKPAKKTDKRSKYKAEYADSVYGLCLLGATDAQIGDFYGVSEQTVNAWKKKYATFLESMKRGKLIADAQVAESLFKRACGYEHPEDRIFVRGNTTIDAKGVQTETSEVIRVPTIKHYPPDTAAAFIWLKNRAGWKDKQTQEHSVSEETAKLLGLIDGKTRGKLPSSQEIENAGE